MREELLKAAQEAVEISKSAGAQDAWAWASRSRSVEYSYRDGSLETVQESTSRGLSVQLYVDGRYSSQSTTDLRPDRLKAFIAEAVAMTRALEVDPFRKIPDSALFAGRAADTLDLVDSTVSTINHDRRLEIVQALDAATHGHEKVISATSGVNHIHDVSAGASSNGFTGSQESTSFWFGAEVTVQDAGDKRPEGYHWVGGRHVGGLPDVSAVGKEALERTVTRMGSAKGPTQKATMIVENRAAGRILGMLMSTANARSIQQGRSFFQGKVGAELVSKKLSITDNPLLPRGLASRLYDGEGIAAKAMPVIEAGVVKNLYVDTYYGGKTSMTPTSGGPSNRVVTPGQGDLAALMKAINNGVLVTEWLGGNADGTTGDFSLGVAGFEVKNGQLGAPIGEMNITGNLVTLFKGLTSLGGDVYPYGGILTPSLVFEGVQFSGA